LVANTLDDHAVHVLPVFRLRQQQDQAPTPETFCGTGFVLEGTMFVTCWHCVEAPLQDGEFYAAIVKARTAEGPQ
jgi:hypothetical protein